MAKHQFDGDGWVIVPLDDILPCVHIPADEEEGGSGTRYWGGMGSGSPLASQYAGMEMARALVAAMKDRDDPMLLMSIVRDMLIGQLENKTESGEEDDTLTLAQIRTVEFDDMAKGCLVMLACLLTETTLRPNPKLGF